MNKIHFAKKNYQTLFPLEDCLCEKVPFPQLTKNWKEVTCKYCLKLKPQTSELPSGAEKSSDNDEICKIFGCHNKM